MKSTNGHGSLLAIRPNTLRLMVNYTEMKRMSNRRATPTNRPLRVIPKRKQALRVDSEAYEQIKLVTWLTKQGIRFYHIPNGGKKSLWEGLKFKRLGVSPGVPDLCIPIPSGSYHGLYIEIKRILGGNVSQNQEDWLAFLCDKGYFARVAKGFEEAKEMILYYFSLTKPAA